MRYSGDCNGIYRLRKRGSEKKRTRRREDEDKIKCGEHRSGERHFSGAGKWKVLVPAYSGIRGTEVVMYVHRGSDCVVCFLEGYLSMYLSTTFSLNECFARYR